MATGESHAMRERSDRYFNVVERRRMRTRRCVAWAIAATACMLVGLAVHPRGHWAPTTTAMVGIFACYLVAVALPFGISALGEHEELAMGPLLADTPGEKMLPALIDASSPMLRMAGAKGREYTKQVEAALAHHLDSASMSTAALLLPRHLEYLKTIIWTAAYRSVAHSRRHGDHEAVTIAVLGALERMAIRDAAGEVGQLLGVGKVRGTRALDMYVARFGGRKAARPTKALADAAQACYRGLTTSRDAEQLLHASDECDGFASELLRPPHDAARTDSLPRPSNDGHAPD